MNYGKTIKLLRNAKQLSQSELAKKIGLDSSYISRIEANKRSPSIENLEQIAKELSVPLYLIILLASEKEDLKGVDTDTTQAIGKNLLNILMNTPAK